MEPLTEILPPHGYVRLINHLGTDQTIVEAARVSYGAKSKGEELDKKLLFYLYKNRHTSPFEQCSITFNIKFPIFLMRQFVRHRTFRLNEISARYTELPDEFFMPNSWREQDTKNKQGSLESTKIPQALVNRTVENIYDITFKTYIALIDLGVSKEQARFVLPVGIYTEIYVNCDVHNLMHFFRLRLDSHAQSEMRDVAQAMYNIFAQLYPWTAEAFETHKLTYLQTAVETTQTIA